MKAAIVPEYDELLDNEMVTWEGSYAESKSYDVDREGYVRLREKFEKEGGSLQTIDRVDIDSVDIVLFVDSDMEYIRKIRKMDDRPAMVYIMREPPCYNSFNSEANLIRWSVIFDHILTWNGDLARQSPYISEYTWPQFLKTEQEEAEDFHNRDLLVNISSRKHSGHPNELYSARENVIEFFAENHPTEFSLYGQWWDEGPRLIDDVYFEQVLSPRRFTDVFEHPINLNEKSSIYHKFKFALCFENQTGTDGWITEKLFDCIRSGTVPVYWGASNIEDYVPSEVFVDYREFRGPESLYQYLSTIDEAEYQKFLDKGAKFLSNKSTEFSPERFASDIYNNIKNVKPTVNEWVPKSIQSHINLHGKADELLNNKEKLGRKEYLRRYISLVRESPSIAVSKPSITYYAFENILPIIPEI